MAFLIGAAADALDDQKAGMMRRNVAPSVDGFFSGMLVLIEGLENL